ncbi:hypothetical protein [Runella salmonicolor]|uniref:Uncharacterized protein n=1 Tax=Runella salmonicolor TaxID=2950278 RepID=A0ABT1FSP5_9BACT|nr:hypothetical protein [Runella salmonicolor]MCP1384789.1 hypothetical protein [Runella salmonicolor]
MAETFEVLRAEALGPITADLTVAANAAGAAGASPFADAAAASAVIASSAASVGLANQWYGIEWDTAVSSSACTRIGNLNLHVASLGAVRGLPIQSKMRGCLLSDAGVVNYYLNPNDWTKKANGTAAVLDGADGMVMVEIPAHYARFETEGTKRRAMISEFALPGFTLVPSRYIGAYEGAVQRSVLKLASVVNTTTDYRGGNNTSAWDAETRTLLGRPATNITRTNFRTYARNRAAGTKWNITTMDAYISLFWLRAIEYANFNTQLAYNATLTAEGYRQGGLGDGVTTLSGATWTTWNSSNPFIPCGQTNSIGNFTGTVNYVMPAEYGTLTVSVPRYRGIENPFGHLWKWLDGVNVNVQSVASGDQSQLYVASNPADFGDTLTNHTLRGLLARAENYIREIVHGNSGDIFGSVVGGAGSSSTTFFADYFYTTIPGSGVSIRVPIVGGAATLGGAMGPAACQLYFQASYADNTIGARLCYIP